MFLPLIPPWWPLSDAFPFLVLTWALTGLLVLHFLPWSCLRLLQMVEQEGAPGGGWSQPLPTAVALCRGGAVQQGAAGQWRLAGGCQHCRGVLKGL